LRISLRRSLSGLRPRLSAKGAEVVDGQGNNGGKGRRGIRMNHIITGDALEEMAKMEANSIDTIITDPPYGLRFMGPKNPWDYEVPSVEVWAECLRVAKPGATLLCFAGTRTQHRMAVNIEDAGWRLVDCLIWLYSQGFPKATDISKQLDKKAGAERKVVGRRTDRAATPKNDFRGGKFHVANEPLPQVDLSAITAPATPEAQLWDGWKSHGLKPAYEPIILAMKPNEGSYADNALKHGVSGLWIDGGRIPLDGTENLDAIQNGNIYGSKGIYGKAKQKNTTPTYKPQGRYPANLILDSESARLLDEQTGVLKSGKDCKRTKPHQTTSMAGTLNTLDREEISYGDSGGPSRFFKVIEPDEEFLRFKYQAKASKKERGDGNKHPTLKPLALMQYLCRLTKTPTGGIVLDPFCGSGSTLVAAQREGRSFIGIDQDPKWTALARRRIEADAPLLNEVNVR